MKNNSHKGAAKTAPVAPGEPVSNNADGDCVYILNKPIPEADCVLVSLELTFKEGMQSSGNATLSVPGLEPDIVSWNCRYRGLNKWAFEAMFVTISNGRKLAKTKLLSDEVLVAYIKEAVSEWLNEKKDAGKSDTAVAPSPKVNLEHAPRPASTNIQVPRQSDPKTPVVPQGPPPQPTQPPAPGSNGNGHNGRGALAALPANLSKTADDEAPFEGAIRVRIDEIIPFRGGEGISGQPRKEFKKGEMDMLVASIKEHGQREVVIVIPISDVPGKKYEIVKGERRWRACGLAGRTHVWVAVTKPKPKQQLHLDALIENLFRAGHTDLELAQALQEQINAGNVKIASFARMKGKGRQTIYNLLALLKLHPDLRNRLDRKLPLIERLNKTDGTVLSIVPMDKQVGIWEEAKKEPTKALTTRKLRELVKPYQNERQRRKDPRDKAKEITRRIKRLELAMAELHAYSSEEIAIYAEFEGDATLGTHGVLLTTIESKVDSFKDKISEARSRLTARKAA